MILQTTLACTSTKCVQSKQKSAMLSGQSFILQCMLLWRVIIFILILSAKHEVSRMRPINRKEKRIPLITERQRWMLTELSVHRKTTNAPPLFIIKLFLQAQLRASLCICFAYTV